MQISDLLYWIKATSPQMCSQHTVKYQIPKYTGSPGIPNLFHRLGVEKKTNVSLSLHSNIIISVLFTLHIVTQYIFIFQKSADFHLIK